MLKRTVATSLITGEQLEFFEPLRDEVEELLLVNAREGRLRERERILRRVLLGPRKTSGEVSF